MFAHTPEELVAEVASIVEIVDYPQGHRIFDKGDAGESMYIVVSAQVRVFDGDKTLSVLGDRELFGELALLDPEPRSASVETMTDTRLFASTATCSRSSWRRTSTSSAASSTSCASASAQPPPQRATRSRETRDPRRSAANGAVRRALSRIVATIERWPVVGAVC